MISDWYGTLAEWAEGGASNYGKILAEHGFEVDQAELDRFHTAWDGVDQREHPVDEDVYLAWTRTRLATLTEACGVPDELADTVVSPLLEADVAAPMAVSPEVAETLAELRRRGLGLAICSNWGWDLESFLVATGVAPLVDVAVTSARAGWRKPHPDIYRHVLEQLGAQAADVVFVGDSWLPDVVSPRAVGMRAVQVQRTEHAAAPELPEGVARVRSLFGLADLPLLAE